MTNMDEIGRRASGAGFTGRRALTHCAALAAGLAAVLAGCGGTAQPTTGDEPAAPSSSAQRRVDRPEAVEARRLLDRGRADLARPLVESLQDLVGLEGPLLLARLEVLEGDRTGWLADIERARAMDPKDPRPYATAAELYAAIGLRDAARREIERGVQAVGRRTPELTRATGVLAIVTQGQAKGGLDLLLAAEREDPELPFLGRALGQAYMLTGRMALAEAPELALERSAKSLEYDPDDVHARHFRAEALIAAALDFKSALPMLEQLLEEGLPIRDDLGRNYWSGGLRAQLRGDRERARDWYLRARELGNTDIEKGVARTLLDEFAKAALGRAIEAAGGRDAETASAELEDALRIAGRPIETYRRAFAQDVALEAQAALDAGDLDRAEGIVALAIEADRRAPSAALVSGRYDFERALGAIEARDVPTALRHARRAAAANPEMPLRWQFLGELEHAAGEFDNAAVSLAKARDFSEASGQPIALDDAMVLAECQVLADRDGDARVTLERALAQARAAGLEGVDEVVLTQAEAMLRVLRN